MKTKDIRSENSPTLISHQKPAIYNPQSSRNPRIPINPQSTFAQQRCRRRRSRSSGTRRRRRRSSTSGIFHGSASKRSSSSSANPSARLSTPRSTSGPIGTKPLSNSYAPLFPIYFNFRSIACLHLFFASRVLSII